MSGRVLTILDYGELETIWEQMNDCKRFLRRLKPAGNHWEKLVEKGGSWRILFGEKLVR